MGGGNSGAAELRACCRALASACLAAALAACGGSRGPARSSIPPEPAPRAARAPSVGTGATHEVRRGDTLWSISRRHGVGVDELREANGIGARESLRVGQEIALPGAPGVRSHVVRPGETLWRIARQHGSSVQELAAANGLRDVTRLEVGQKLRVPGASTALTARRDRSAERWTRADRRGRADASDRFVWPVNGRVSSRFGMRRNHHHDGLDISAPRGTPVYAAASGRVIHADDSLSGYGKMVILKHGDRYSTVYAHNDRVFVKVGQFVERGECIAEVGQTGRASHPHLHFEVRYDGRPRDPLGHLR